MRIKYVHHGLWPSPSPSTTFVTWNCLGFTEIGADFELVTMANTAKDVDQVLAEDFGITTSLRIRLLHAGPLRRYHRIVHFLIFCHLLFARWDVVITRNLGFLPWALLLRAVRGGKVIFESHDFYSDPGLRDDSHGRSAGLHGRRERRWLPRANGVLCVSEAQRQYYRQSYPHLRFFTAVAGVKPAQAAPRNSPLPGGVVGYLGSFDAARYDLDLILRAIGRVAVPGCRLIMAGARSEAEAASMRDRAVALGVGDRVEVMQWQTPLALESLKARLNVGLAPLAMTPRNRIGSPLKVLEYLAAGIPSVGSDLPGIRYLLDEGPCGLVADATPEEWAAAITRILSEPALAEALSVAARARAEDLSWSRRAARILSFLEARGSLDAST